MCVSYYKLAGVKYRGVHMLHSSPLRHHYHLFPRVHGLHIRLVEMCGIHSLVPIQRAYREQLISLS